MAQNTQPTSNQDNLGSQYRNFKGNIESIAREKRLNDLFGITPEQIEEETPAENKDVSPTRPDPQVRIDPSADAVITLTKKPSLRKKILENLVEIPAELFEGATVGAANAAVDLIGDLGDELVNLGLPDSFIKVVNEKGEIDLDLLNPTETELAEAEGLILTNPQLDTGRDPDTPTGKISRAIGKELTFFIPAFRAARALTTAKGIRAAAAAKGVKTTMAVSAAEGAAADSLAAFIADDPFSPTISALIKDEFPSVEPVISDYLADDDPENNTEWELRLKKAFEAAGFGAVIGTLIDSFKLLKAANTTRKKAAAELDPFQKEEIEQIKREASIDNAAPVSAEELEALGNPDDVPFLTGKQAAERFKEAEKRVGEKLEPVLFPEDEIFVNLARIDAPDDIRNLIQDVANADADAINIKRGGAKKTNKQTVRESQEAFKDLAELLGREPGPMTAAEAVASRKILNSSANQLLELSRIAHATGKDTDIYNARRAMSLHYAIQSEVIAARTETARSLQSWAIDVGTDEERGKTISKLLETSHGKKSSAQLIEMLAKFPDNPAALNRAVEEFSQATFSDVVYQYWINSILSQLTTQSVNILGNGLNMSFAIPRKMMGATLSQTIGSGEIAFREINSELFGMVKGMRTGLRLMWHGKDAKGVGDLAERFEQFGKVEGQHDNIISAEAIGLGPDSAFVRGAEYLGLGNGRVGKFINLPTSGLKKVDTFFKSIAYSMHVETRAFRAGMEKGLEGKELSEFIHKFSLDPPKDLKAEAMDVADIMAFTNPLRGNFGKLTKQLKRLPTARWVIPFTQTPTNIVITTMKDTPLAAVSSAVRADIAAGGARAEEAWGRIGAGTILMTVVTDMGLEGTITGKGPADPRLRKNLMRTGWKPHSIKTDEIVDGKNVYVPINRLDPTGNLIALGGMFAEVINNIDDDDAEMGIATMIYGSYDFLKSKIWLKNVTDLLAAIDPGNPRRTVEDFAGNFGASFVPGILRQASRLQDPRLKQTRTSIADPALKEGLTGFAGEFLDMKTALFMQETINEIHSRVPYLGADLPLRVDLWGNPIDLSSGFGLPWDLISPIYARLENPDRLDKVLIDNEIPLSHVRDSISGVKLTGQELFELATMSGKMLRGEIEFLVDDPSFNLMTNGPHGEKAEEIKATMREVRADARDIFLEEHPKVNNRILTKQKLEEQLLSGGQPSDQTAGMPALPMATDGQETAGDASLETILGGR